jgi:hypothetical protein
MPIQSLAELHEQGRHNYIYWPLWLALKQRQVEQHLMQTQPEIKLLRALALPLPEDIPAFTATSAEPVAGTDFRFTGKLDGNVAVLTCHRISPAGQNEACDLLRVDATNDWYIQQAVEQFNLALKSHTPSLVFQAACLWVSFHGTGFPHIQWQTVPDTSQTISDSGWE